MWVALNNCNMIRKHEECTKTYANILNRDCMLISVIFFELQHHTFVMTIQEHYRTTSNQILALIRVNLHGFIPSTPGQMSFSALLVDT